MVNELLIREENIEFVGARSFFQWRNSGEIEEGTFFVMCIVWCLAKDLLLPWVNVIVVTFGEPLWGTIWYTE